MKPIPLLALALAACSSKTPPAADTSAPDAPATSAPVPDAPAAPAPDAPAAPAPAAPAPFEIQLLAFNDFHGALEPPAGKSGQIVTDAGPVDAGGAEFFATWIDKLRAAHGRTLVVAAGDNIGATPLLSAAFHDEPTVEALNLVGLAITSVGNHEFDEGIDELRRMQKGGCHPVDGCFGGDGFDGARYHYLAANVFTDDGATLFPPYEIRSFADPADATRKVDVAFIGMTLEGTPEVVTAAGVKGVSFKDEAETVNALIPELHQKGVHAIVVLLHEGGFATGRYDACEGISGPIFEIAKAFDKDVDVVVSGHTNAAHVCDIDGKLVTSAAHWGRLLTDIRLELDPATGDVAKKSAHNVIVRRDVDKAPAMTVLIDRYKDLVKGVEARVVGTTAIDLGRTPSDSGETPLGSVIADAQRFAESDPSTGGAQLALMNPGGIRADLLVDHASSGEKPGEVTFGEVFSVQPFNNALVTMTLTGAQLDAVLEQQFRVADKDRDMPKILQISEGFHYTWDERRPPGDRVDPATITLDGQPVDPAKGYRVVMNEFLGNGGDGFDVLKQGTDRRIGIMDVDALELYVKKHPGLGAPTPGRITHAK